MESEKKGLAGYFEMLKIGFKDTKALVQKSVGITLVYIFICDIIVQLGIFKLLQGIWTLAMKTVPNHYISDSNIKQIFTHPLVIVAAIVIAAIFCFACVWENAGLIMILEYHYQGKSVKLLPVLWESLKQIKHLKKPSNWLMFLYVLLILPLIDSQMSSQTLSTIVIPEYISDYIFSKAWLTLLIIVAVIAVFIFYLRYIFVQYSFVLEKKDFHDAAGESISYGKGNRIFTFITQPIVSGLASLVYILIPLVILIVGMTAINMGLENYSSTDAITSYFINNWATEFLNIIASAFTKIIVLAYVLILYHRMAEQKGIALDIQLDESIVKKEGKIRSLKGFIAAAYVVVFVAIFAATSIIIVASETNPEILADFISETKIAAHKGYSSKAPENTLDAIELAANDDNVEYIEIDIRSTKDGVPVLIHNESIYDATGVDESVYDMNLDELQKLNASYSFSEDEFPNAYIPTLEEVLQKYAGKKDFLIEIKDSDRSPDLPVQIAQLMEKYGITETSMIHSGSYSAISKVKEYNPNIKCGFIMAIATGGFYDLENADFFSIEHNFASSNVITAIHNRGKKVFAWTVNETDSMEEMKDAGVDCVITDYPDDCADILYETSRDMAGVLMNKSNNQLNNDWVKWLNGERSQTVVDDSY